MQEYKFTVSKAHHHFLEIEFSSEIKAEDDFTLLQLPSWRPGRYELGNFAKNIQQFIVFDQDYNPISFEKNNKDQWKVHSKGCTKILVKYVYYANELNAGSTFIDETQWYVNPVNCCIYIPESIDYKIQLNLDIPENWVIACGQYEEDNILIFDDFHQFVDSPFIASPTLQHNSYQINDIDFHIWIQGECKPNWDKVIEDFEKFTQIQIDTFHSFPVKNYHFIIQILPYQAYHGVEHYNSTVIALGPSYEIMNQLYNELLGVSSHELYHTWNIKNIRPKEMFPYDYTKENYSYLGYVYEGVTTYMGDLMLFRSDVFSTEQYQNELRKNLTRHFHNGGRNYYSVSQSSFDTWLDGYVAGIPYRKTSIYTEGSWISFMLDILIMKKTNNKYSLNDVMRKLYQEYGLKNKGFSEKDYKLICEEFYGSSLDTFFNSYVWSTKSYQETLDECFTYIGWEVKVDISEKISHQFGMKIQKDKVLGVYENSIAYHAGIHRDDEIIFINHIKVNNDTENWLRYFKKETHKICINRKGVKKEFELKLEPNEHQYFSYNIMTSQNCSNEQLKNLESWKNKK